MTVIVYRDGQCWADDLVHVGDLLCGRMIKIGYRAADRAILAGSGSTIGIQTFLRLAAVGKEREYRHDCESTTAIIIFPDGRIQQWDNGAYDEIRADYYTIGSGKHAAMGALICGASARGACIAACQAMGWRAGLHAVNHDGEWSTGDTAEWEPQPKSREVLNGTVEGRNRSPKARSRSAGKKRRRSK